MTDAITVGAVTTIGIAISGFLLKRYVEDQDKLSEAHALKLDKLTEKLSELIKEHAITNERMLKLIRLDEKVEDHERRVTKLEAKCWRQHE